MAFRLVWRGLGLALVGMALWAPTAAFADEPANDDLANAQPVVAGVPITSDTREAFREDDEPGPPHSAGASGNTVWYVWTAPSDVRRHVELRFTASNYPGSLPCVDVFAGGPPPQQYGVTFLSIGDIGSCAFGQFFDAYPGINYYFQVGSVNSGSGTSTMSFTTTRFAADIQLTQTATTTAQVGQTIIVKSTVSNQGPDPATVDLSLARPLMQLQDITNATCDDPQCSTATVDELGPGQSVVVTSTWLAFQTGPHVGVDVAASIQWIDDPTPAEALSSTAVTLPKADLQLLVGDGGFSFVSTKHTTPAGHMWWWWAGGSPHTVTDESGLGLFDLSLAADHFDGFRFFVAGSYPVVDQSTDERMTVVVPISIAPKTGSAATVFSVSWASRAAPSGLTYEIDLARPGGKVFVPWAATSVRGATFIPDAGPGKYRFRARLIRSTDDTVSTGWVTKTLTVT